MDLQQAHKRVARLDPEREALIRRLFGRDIHDVLLHDLVLNTGILSTEACARIIADAYRLKFSEQGVEPEALRESVV